MADTRLCTEWRDDTLHMLKHRPRSLTYDMITDATGLPRAWLVAFIHDKIPDPGVNRIETLNKFLKKYAAETIGNVQPNS